MSNGVVTGLNQVVSANANIFRFVLASLFGALFSIADLLSNFVFYLCITVMYVNSDTGLIRSMLNKVPDIKVDTVNKVETIFETPIKIVFNHNVGGVVAQGIFTWIIFDFLGAKYIYFHCILAAIFKLIPIVPVQAIAFLGATNLYFRQYTFGFVNGPEGNVPRYLELDIHVWPCDPWIRIGVLVSSYIYVSYSIVNDALETYKIDSGLDSTMVGYSFCLGFYAFGLIGVIYGPILFSLVWVIYEIMRRCSFVNGHVKFDSSG